MKLTQLFKTLTVASFVAGAGMSTAMAQETLKVHGSTTVFANIFESHQAKLESDTGLKFDIISNGSGNGLKDLIAGSADVAMISSTLESAAKKLEDQSVVSSLVSTNIGISKVAFVVHPSNTVKKLTIEQAKGILLGTIKNWSEVGGSDAPITVVTEVATGGIRSTVEKDVTKAPFAGNLKEVPNAPQAVKITSQLPTAFGLATMATANASVSVVETDEKIEQPLELITKGAPSASAQKLIDAAKALNIK